MSDVRSFRDLQVWQKGMKLTAMIYQLSQLMPRDERFRLTDQMLRSAASVPANIAEGHLRGTRRDYARFVTIARGSLGELETYLILATDVGILAAENTTEPLALAAELGRMLNGLRRRLEEPQQSRTTYPET